MNATDTAVLRPLAERIAALAARPSEAAKKELWARHQALLRTDKIPITLNSGGIPEPQWELMLGRDCLQCSDDFARGIELGFRRRIWAAEHIGDDQIVWPIVKVPAVSRQSFDWGVALEWRDSGAVLGAKGIIAPFSERIDVSRVRFTDADVDAQATHERVETVRRLIGGALKVIVIYPSLGHSPFEIATEMCGIEGLMLYAADSPEDVDALMEVITSAYLAHHKRREREGRLNVWLSADGRYLIPSIWRVNCSHAPKGAASSQALAHEWAYVSAQSAAGLGPAMFERFAHRFNRRLAELFTNDTVYFHGCERLDHKLDVLATLPHLRRFHVSPWSSVAAARDKFRGAVVLEVHSHPGKVFFTMSPEDMRREIRGLIDSAQGVPMDLNLSDINSVNGKPETLTTWARIAQEESARR